MSGLITVQELDNNLKSKINEVETLSTEVDSHFSEMATNEKYGHIKLSDIPGGIFTGIAKAHSNTSYSVAQIRNIIVSLDNANVDLMQDGDIWIKYK